MTTRKSNPAKSSPKSSVKTPSAKSSRKKPGTARPSKKREAVENAPRVLNGPLEKALRRAQAADRKLSKRSAHKTMHVAKAPASAALQKDVRAKVPQPVGDRRITPLPETHPKPPQDDPRAAKRLAKILAGTSYRSAADNDPDFLRHPLTRAVRLQLDYYKPELLMREYRIEGTIVVFGSTRTPEPKAAKRQLREALAAWAAHPGSVKLEQNLKRAERIVEKSHYYDTARKFGKLVSKQAAHKSGPRVVVVTGGGPGIMEAANRGAFDAKAPTVGLNITLPHEQYPNSYITPELCFQFHYFAIRKLHFLLRAKAMVAFPGGYGTLDELFETLTLMQTRKIKPMPIILVGESFWKHAIDIDFLVEEGVIDPEDKDLFWYAETAEEVWNGILEWYKRKGETLLGENREAAAPIRA